MFAVIKSGGKQYKVALGSILKLEKLEAKKNSNIVFKEVLMVKNDESYQLGSPFLKDVEVKGKILENKKDKKVIIFKKRRRHNSRRKNGHRQNISVVQINEITINGKLFKDNKQSKKIETKKPSTVLESKQIKKAKSSTKGVTVKKVSEKKG